MNKSKTIFNIFVILILLVYVTGSIYSNPNSNITVSSNNRGVLIGTNDRTVKIFIPSRTLNAVSERSGGGQNNPNYFYLTDRSVRGISVPLHFSGWLLPIENFRHNSVAEFWMEQFSRIPIFNYEIIEVGD
ncbi:MAG: hypothetical protein FWD47_10540 [Treponema sp.]|nr:hypothetical protein [Treponema sp.]